MFSIATMTIVYGLMIAAIVALVLLTAWNQRHRWLPSRWSATGRKDAHFQPRSTNVTTPAVPAGESAVSKSVWETSGLGHRGSLFAPLHEDRPTLRRVDPDEIPTENPKDYVLGGLTPAVAQMLPESAQRRVQWKKDLRTAGYHSPRAWQNFAATRYLFIIVPLIILGVAMVVVPPAFEMPVAIALLIVPLLGWAIPALVVRGRVTTRTAEIARAMPDFIDMLNMCVSQGLTVVSSIKRIRRQLAEPYPDLATELAIVIEQSEVGTLPHALENFAERVDVPEVHSLTTLLIQTDRMGTSVSSALREYADGLRESLRQRADEKANRASFRLLFPTVLCLMPAVYLILLGPAMNEMNRFFWSENGGRNLIEQSRQAVEVLEAR